MIMWLKNHHHSLGIPRLLAWAVLYVQQEKKTGSQEALATLAEIDRSYMSGIERDEHNLAIMNLLKITDALEVKASNLLSETGN